MENNINILDLLIQELNRTESLKSSIEAKAIGYMTPVTLILGILATFLTEVWDKKDICQVAWNGLFWGSIALFVLGVVLFVLFARVLMPSEMKYFDAAELIRLYTKKSPDIEKTAKIINDAANAVYTNSEKMEKLSKFNKRISIGLFVLIGGFIIASILFFIIIR